MAQSGQLSVKERLDHTRYNFKNIDSVNEVLETAVSFVAYLRGNPKEDADTVKARIGMFVTLITANDDPEVSRDIFRQVSFQVPELRSTEIIRNPNQNAMAYLLHLTSKYRPQAPEELPLEAVYFTRSVTRQLESFGQTQRESRTENEMMQAILSSLAVRDNQQLGSPSGGSRPPMNRQTSRIDRPVSGVGSPGTYSPSAQQTPTGGHARTFSGTSGRRDETESGSLQDLRARRNSMLSPPSASRGIIEGMGSMQIRQGVASQFPNITATMSSDERGRAGHSDAPRSRAPSQDRGRSNDSRTGPGQQQVRDSSRASNMGIQRDRATTFQAPPSSYQPGPGSPQGRSRSGSISSMAPPRMHAPPPNVDSPLQPRRLSISGYGQQTGPVSGYPQGPPDFRLTGSSYLPQQPTSSYPQGQQQPRSDSRPPAAQSDRGRSSSRAPSNDPRGRSSGSRAPATGGPSRSSSTTKPATKQSSLSSFFRKPT